MNDLTALTCREVFDRLDDFVDRELTAEEQRRVEQHLALCAHCTQRYRFERTVLETLKAKLRRIAVPEGLVARVTAALVEERQTPGREEPRTP